MGIEEDIKDVSAKVNSGSEQVSEQGYQNILLLVRSNIYDTLPAITKLHSETLESLHRDADASLEEVLTLLFINLGIDEFNKRFAGRGDGLAICNGGEL